MSKSLGTCECADILCPFHTGHTKCSNSASVTLHRIDMEDRTGTAFCDVCAEDASSCGLFITREEDEPEEMEESE